MHVLLHSSGPFPKKIETSSHMYFKNSQSLYRVNLLSDQFVQNAKNNKNSTFVFGNRLNKGNMIRLCYMSMMFFYLFLRKT